MTHDRPILAYFGHHKCATTYTLRVVGDICRYMGLRHLQYHSPKMWGYPSHGTPLDEFAVKSGLDFVSFTNSDPRYIGDISNYLGFHLIRDPRDMVVSAYFSHKHSHGTDGWPELTEFRAALESLPKNEGMMESIKFTARLPTDGWNIEPFRAMMDWDYSRDNIMQIKFEDMVSDPYQTFLDAFKFMKLTCDSDSTFPSLLAYYLRSKNRSFRNPRISAIPEWMVLLKIHRHRFTKATKGRPRGVSDVTSHYRNGMPGDWKNHFTSEHKAYFKREYTDLLIKLGYEKDDKW